MAWQYEGPILFSDELMSRDRQVTPPGKPQNSRTNEARAVKRRE
jgi:hypothetical protein